MIALTLLEGIGPRTAKSLLQKIEDVEEIFTDRHFLKKYQLEKSAKLKLALQSKKGALIKAEEYLNFAIKNGVQVLNIVDKNYPYRLLQCPDAPIVLYAKGDFEKHPKKTIAIVGTRNMTNYGRAILEELISGIKNYQIQVVSGLAYGVDVDRKSVV